MNLNKNEINILTNLQKYDTISMYSNGERLKSKSGPRVVSIGDPKGRENKKTNTRRMIMKKVFSCLLVALMLASMLAMGVSAAWDEAGTYPDYGTIANVDRRSIRLDAKKDEAYAAATPLPINNRQEGGDPQANAVAYMVYDSEYIWVYVEVNDATLDTKASSPLESKYTEDSIEVVIDFTNEGKNKKNVAPHQCRISHEGYVSGRIGNGGTSLFGTAEQGSATPVDFLDAFATHRADGTGYDCELRIAPPFDTYKIGDRIGLNIVINDWNAGKRTVVTSHPTDPVIGTNWQVESFGSIAFDHSAPYTADTTIIYVVAAMAAAVVIGTVTLVSLKKKAR